MNITDLTSLPTDNLYKFMAMSGLVIAIASVALAAHHYRQVQRRFFDIKRRIIVHKAKIKATEDDVDISRKLTSELKRQMLARVEAIKLAQSSGLTGARVQEGSSQEYQDALDSIEGMTNTNIKAIAQHDIEVAEIEADSDELAILSTQLQTLSTSSLAGVVIGALLTGSGFFLWYTKVQVLLDQALAVQSSLPK